MQRLWSAKLDLWSQHRDLGLWNHLTDADRWLPLHFALLWAAVSFGVSHSLQNWHLTVNNTGSYTRFINKVAWGESLSTTDQTAGAASVHMQLKSGMHLNWEVCSMFKSRQIFKQPHVQDGRTASRHKSHEHCSALKSLMKSCVLHKAASLSLEDCYCYSTQTLKCEHSVTWCNVTSLKSHSVRLAWMVSVKNSVSFVSVAQGRSCKRMCHTKLTCPLRREKVSVSAWKSAVIHCVDTVCLIFRAKCSKDVLI